MVNKFLTNLEIKFYSQYTLRNYRICLDHFFQFYSKDISELRLEDTFRWFVHLRSTLSYNYSLMHLTVLRCFLKWCLINDIKTLHYAKIEIVKKDHVFVSYLERDELERLLEVDMCARDKAIIHMLYSTGCRVAELARLDRYQILDGQVSVLGKGNKHRLVFVSQYAKNALSKYLWTRRDNSPALFINHRKKRLSVSSIERIVREAARAANIDKRVTPHTIRHTFATQLVRNKAPLIAIQKMLGHSSITTTQIYLHVSDPYLREIHENYHR